MRQPRLSPLAAAVLELLHEKPMHPYEIRQLVTGRGLDSVINVKAASLYSTVERLEKKGLIEAVETSREGRRPERTVYRITDDGVDQLLEDLRLMISEPLEEYPIFGAGLAFLAVFGRDEAVKLLEWRTVRLEALIAALEATLSGVTRAGIPRLFTIESEWALNQRRADLKFTSKSVHEIKSGSLPWPNFDTTADEKG